MPSTTRVRAQARTHSERRAMEPLADESVVYEVLDTYGTVLRATRNKLPVVAESELTEDYVLCIGETFKEQDAETLKKCYLTPEDTHAAAGGKYIRVIGGQDFENTFVLGPNFFKNYSPTDRDDCHPPFYDEGCGHAMTGSGQDPYYKMCQELCDVCKQVKTKMQPKIDAALALIAEPSDEEEEAPSPSDHGAKKQKCA
jgi:hypothetical protein